MKLSFFWQIAQNPYIQFLKTTLCIYCHIINKTHIQEFYTRKAAFENRIYFSVISPRLCFSCTLRVVFENPNDGATRMQGTMATRSPWAVCALGAHQNARKNGACYGCHDRRFRSPPKCKENWLYAFALPSAFVLPYSSIRSVRSTRMRTFSPKRVRMMSAISSV